jgi:hypothetical protein
LRDCETVDSRWQIPGRAAILSPIHQDLRVHDLESAIGNPELGRIPTTGGSTHAT